MTTTPISPPKPPRTFREFMQRQEATRKLLENAEHPWVRVAINLFPDITAVLELPLVNKMSTVRSISENIGPISICIIVSSIGISTISMIGVACSSGVVKLTCSVIFLNSQGVGAIFTLSYLKKYFALRRNHQHVQIINRVVQGLYLGADQLQKQLETHKTLNDDQAKTVEKQKENLEEHKAQLERITQLAEALKAAPENLKKILGKVQEQTKIKEGLELAVQQLQGQVKALKGQVQASEAQQAAVQAQHQNFLGKLSQMLKLSTPPPKSTKSNKQLPE